MNPPLPRTAAVAVFGWLPPVAGALARESIALAVITTALRAVLDPASHRGAPRRTPLGAVACPMG